MLRAATRHATGGKNERAAQPHKFAAHPQVYRSAESEDTKPKKEKGEVRGNCHLWWSSSVPSGVAIDFRLVCGSQ